MFTRRFRHLVFFNETMATRTSSETAYQANVKNISSFQPNKLLISITTRAVHRLCVIGSPRGAAEKFNAKRVIGSVFFWSGHVGRVIRGNPIAPLDANATMRQFKHPEIRLFDGIYLCQQCQVNIWRGYNCIKHHPWDHFCENLRERLLQKKKRRVTTPYLIVLLGLKKEVSSNFHLLARSSFNHETRYNLHLHCSRTMRVLNWEF